MVELHLVSANVDSVGIDPWLTRNLYHQVLRRKLQFLQDGYQTESRKQNFCPL